MHQLVLLHAARLYGVANSRKHSAEREYKSLYVSLEEFDFERAIDNRLWLANELIEPLFGDHAVALLIDVGAVRGTRGLAVD